ncbi:MAG: thioesterase [Desulfobulbaceae bacterium A2]|nr:MAG: thioesterase [Desulfobulbaceae bacterium A2]
MQIELTDPIHHLYLRVLYADTDAGGVVYNASYLRFFEAGRTEMVRALGVPYSTLEQRGIILPLTECGVRYKAPARYDDLLTVSTSLVALSRASCRFNYRITREQEHQPEQLLTLGYTIHACINKEGRPCRFPSDVIQFLKLLRPDSSVDIPTEGV